MHAVFMKARRVRQIPAMTAVTEEPDPGPLQ